MSRTDQPAQTAPGATAGGPVGVRRTATASTPGARLLSPYQGRFHTVSGGTARASSTGRREPELDLVVEGLHQVADGVAAVTLRDPGGFDLPTWSPGAHLDLVLPDGRAAQYSLCGDPDDRKSYRVGVLRRSETTSTSHAVHQLTAGTVLRVRGPRNLFAMAPARAYLFLAGGIGITPLLPMVRRADAEGIPWQLVYTGRSRSAMAFLGELEGHGDRVIVWARDERGSRVDVAELVRQAPADALIYCCGPTALLEAVEQAGAELAPRRVRTERFSAVPVDQSEDRPLQVRCELSDIDLVVAPGTSILDVAHRAGIPTVSSCGKGICGTCETVVLHGEPEHRDSVLDEDDRAGGDTMMICVSRAVGPRLVLDL